MWPTKLTIRQFLNTHKIFSWLTDWLIQINTTEVYHTLQQHEQLTSQSRHQSMLLPKLSTTTSSCHKTIINRNTAIFLTNSHKNSDVCVSLQLQLWKRNKTLMSSICDVLLLLLLVHVNTSLCCRMLFYLNFTYNSLRKLLLTAEQAYCHHLTS